ncbi:OB-fold nucleic acid binding domain-containing protein [Desulfosarcina sp.]|nr:OB-fold nucleic acid binding domain-containing protein [Desulfosarcina sp.]
MRLPVNEVISRIKEATTLSEEEIEEKIKKKTEQLSGLISKEGAAQIIANELGVKLFQLEGPVKIDRVVGGMKSVETVGKITRKFDVSNFTTKDGREGKVGSITIGDDTGRIRVTFWNDMADKLANFNEGDILKVSDAYARVNNNKVELHMSDRSKFTLNPEGVVMDEVKEFISNRKKIEQLTENEENVELLGTIVQVFEPRFFEICPECNRRARQRDDKFECTEHGFVIPKFSFVMNAHIDDGTGNMRAVFFKNQAKVLLGMEEADILKFKEDPAAFENMKQDMLGNFVKMVGRVTKNTMFDRLEFISQMVFPNPDPKEELEKTA